MLALCRGQAGSGESSLWLAVRRERGKLREAYAYSRLWRHVPLPLAQDMFALLWHSECLTLWEDDAAMAAATAALGGGRHDRSKAKAKGDGSWHILLEHASLWQYIVACCGMSQRPYLTAVALWRSASTRWTPHKVP